MQALCVHTYSLVTLRVGLISKYYARINSNIPLVAPSQVLLIVFTVFLFVHIMVMWLHNDNCTAQSFPRYIPSYDMPSVQNTNSAIRPQTVANQDHTCCVTEYIIRILEYESVYMPLSEGSIIYTCEARSCPLKTHRHSSFIQDAKFLFILPRPNVFTQPNTGSTLIDVVRKQPIVKTSLSGGLSGVCWLILFYAR